MERNSTAGAARTVRQRAMRLITAAAIGVFAVQVHAQGGPRLPLQAHGPPPWAMELPGYWASLITEDWRLRMVTPPKGDYVGIPLTAAAKRVADAWDPVKDEADGDQCRSYGAAAIMFRPEQLQIAWLDNGQTLEMNVDGGMQTRLFHFGDAAVRDVNPSWQGYSTATWIPRRSQGVPFAANARYLHVTTARMLSGYLRQNGVPYSANATLTEDYDLIQVSDHEAYLSVTTTVKDPLYLDYPLVLSALFEKQRDKTGWNPTPCSATW